MIKFTKTNDLEKTIETHKKHSTKSTKPNVEKSPDQIKHEKELAFDRHTYNYCPFKDLIRKSNG